MADFTQWSSLGKMLRDKPSWVPEEDQERVGAYTKYDELYWNDPTQFALRILEGEQPLYIPNARTIVDTTASFMLKGLTLTVPNASDNASTRQALDLLLDREMFYPKFQTAKHAGVTRGDYFIHITSNPLKPAGSRISLTAVDPRMVFPIFDDDNPDVLVGCHLAQEYYLPDEPDTTRIRKLTYRVDTTSGSKRITREEGIYSLEEKWYGPKAKLIQKVLPLAALDPAITTIPVYWFKNRDWNGDLFGSSELRGFETLIQAASQGATDINTALALEGLGVYATDGGRPVNDQGAETDWEVSPGRVMEVPAGSYFRRVEGVGSITPAKDHIDYLETKLMAGAGITDIALGRADVAIAQSGIALAIKFMPTLAKIEGRDTWAQARLKQLFYDWKIWYAVVEGGQLSGEIIAELGDKLPMDRTGRLTELNNMIDRRVISRQYYREEAGKMGYIFPNDIEAEIQKDLELAQALTSSQNKSSENPAEGEAESTVDQSNQSNNKSRPNESSGTEASQSLDDQATGGKP